MENEFGKIGARYVISGLATRMFIEGKTEEAGKLVCSGCTNGIKISREMMKMFSYAHELGTIMEERLKDFNITDVEKFKIAQQFIDQSILGGLVCASESEIPVSFTRKSRKELNIFFDLGYKIGRILNKDDDFSWHY